MSKFVVWDYEDGRITVTHVNPGYTDPSQIEAVKVKVQGIIESESGSVIRHDYDPDLLPEPSDDQRFFDVWEWVGDAVVVNMPKARVLHMDKIRRVRNAELAKLDITYMRAIEAGDTDAQATIATEKQTLRDIPATFDITTDVDTPAQLKAKWPAELPE